MERILGWRGFLAEQADPARDPSAWASRAASMKRAASRERAAARPASAGPSHGRREFLAKAARAAAGTALAAGVGSGLYNLLAGASGTGLEVLLSRKTPPGSPFTYPDVATRPGFELYAEVCDRFIASRGPNPLGLTGEMMARSARKALRETGVLVPPELALAQLVQEGGVGVSNPRAVPVRTRNPFNILNTDSGRLNYYKTPADGVDAYYKLVAEDYLLGGKRSPEDLVRKGSFVNMDGKRYASDRRYEAKVRDLARSARKMARAAIQDVLGK